MFVCFFLACAHSYIAYNYWLQWYCCCRCVFYFFFFFLRCYTANLQQWSLQTAASSSRKLTWFYCLFVFGNNNTVKRWWRRRQKKSYSDLIYLVINCVIFFSWLSYKIPIKITCVSLHILTVTWISLHPGDRHWWSKVARITIDTANGNQPGERKKNQPIKTMAF